MKSHAPPAVRCRACIRTCNLQSLQQQRARILSVLTGLLQAVLPVRVAYPVQPSEHVRQLHAQPGGHHGGCTEAGPPPCLQQQLDDLCTWQTPSRERDKNLLPGHLHDMHGRAYLAAQMLCRTAQYCASARAGTTQHDAFTLVGGPQVTLMASPNAQVTIFFCRGCGRYLQPPRHWVKAELESRELLTFCVKRIRGLGKVGDVGDSNAGDGE